MNHIKFACYSDIHHHEYCNGITGQDVENVEEEFRQLCIKEKVDFWIFGGDRFLSRNPLDISRKRADEALKKKNDSGITGYILVGNHDRWTKNPHSGHNLYNIGLYEKEFDKIGVMATLGQTTWKVKDSLVQFYAIPAGHKSDDRHIEMNTQGKADYRICLVHDIIKGCRYTNGIVAPEGVSPALLDKKVFDLVLGGDNHHPQDLGFTNTIGKYIGAPMQHNWGDLGSPRGFLLVEMWKENGTTRISTKFVESKAPKFIKEEFSITNDQDLMMQFSKVGSRWQNHIVKLTISGNESALKGLQLTKLTNKIRAASGARQLKISTKYNEPDIIETDAPVATTPDQEYRDYLKYKAVDYAGLDLNKLERMGLELIIEADNE